MIVIAAKMIGKPERRADILRLVATVAQPSRAEAGCITYNFYERQPPASEFLFFEEWADQAAVDSHLKTPYFQEFMKQIPELIQGPPKIRLYEVAKSRDL
jgi:quinol monooxygenase YgiN